MATQVEWGSQRSYSWSEQYYKLYLDILTLPILVIGFYIPQGSLVYRVTNSSLTVIQQLSLNHPAIREKLALPNKHAPVTRLALEKNPDHVRSIVVLGQTMLQKGMLTEATEYFECAMSKLFVAGLPTKDEEVDLLILSSSWAGVACIWQERFEEGLEHLQRIVQLEEPEDPKGEAHYFDGLLLLASALLNDGRKDEAVEYLRIVVAYDHPKVTTCKLQQCLLDDGYITLSVDCSSSSG